MLADYRVPENAHRNRDLQCHPTVSELGAMISTKEWLEAYSYSSRDYRL
jgi:hypothetical protein